MRLAIRGALFVHRFSRDLACPLELHVAMVAGRRSAHFADHVHQNLRAVGGQPQPGHGVFCQHLLAGGDCRHGLGIGNVAHPKRTANGNRLEVLRSHHRTDTGAPGCAVQIVDDRREEDLILAGATNAGHPQQGILVTLLERAFGVPDGPAPEILRGKQCRLVVLDMQIDRARGLALGDDHVPPGRLEFGAEEASGIRAGDDTGQWPLGDHGIAAAGRRHRPGQRAGGIDDLVLRRQWVDQRVNLADQILAGQPTLTGILRRPGHVQRFADTDPLGEVNAKNLAYPSHDPLLKRVRHCQSSAPIDASARGPSSPHRHR